MVWDWWGKFHIPSISSNYVQQIRPMEAPKATRTSVLREIYAHQALALPLKCQSHGGPWFAVAHHLSICSGDSIRGLEIPNYLEVTFWDHPKKVIRNYWAAQREHRTSRDWYKIYFAPLLCAWFSKALSAGTKASGFFVEKLPSWSLTGVEKER